METGIKLLKEKGFTAGYPDGSFGPLNNINRAEILTMLMHKLGVDIPKVTAGCGFSDVKPSDWFAPFVCFAKSKGFAAGYPDGTFGPGKPVNFVEALALTERIFNYKIQEDANEWFHPFVTQVTLNLWL